MSAAGSSGVSTPPLGRSPEITPASGQSERRASLRVGGNPTKATSADLGKRLANCLNLGKPQDTRRSKKSNATAPTQLTPTVKKQYQQALMQCLGVVVCALKTQRDPTYLKPFEHCEPCNFLEMASKSMSIAFSGEGSLEPLPELLQQANSCYSHLQLYRPFQSLETQTLEAAQTLCALVANVNKHLEGFQCLLGGGDNLYAKVQQSLTELNTALAKFKPQGVSCFNSKADETNHLQEFLQAFFNLAQAATLLRNTLNSVDENTSNISSAADCYADNFDLLRRFGQFPPALASHMLNNVFVLDFLDKATKNGWLGYGEDALGLRSFSPSLLQALECALQASALPDNFGGNYRLNSEHQLIVDNNEHQIFLGMLSALCAVDRCSSDKRLVRVFYTVMHKLLSFNGETDQSPPNVPAPIFVQGDKLVAANKHFAVNPIQSSLQNLFLPSVENGNQVFPPFTARQLMMQACISDRAFAHALYLQVQHLLGPHPNQERLCCANLFRVILPLPQTDLGHDRHAHGDWAAQY